ncbi:metallophosphoesterase [Longispora sp. K20-0274]|uniref:metallophosphoesterase n=1 Tax=Longispora sp. K20-0274 TaxID=3088255 RepID=UPI00399A0998
MTRSTSPVYVVADVHGHRAELRAALRAAGLADAAGDWSGGRARLWFLGDYVDRGPDGLGVIDDIRRLAARAATVGGEVGALLGNHELQLLGAHLFGSAPVPGWDHPGGLHGTWLLWGGRQADLDGLTAEHLAWLRALPAVALVDDHLLLHSDTTRYLEFGRTVADANAAVARTMAGTDIGEWFEAIRRVCDRNSFKGAGADEAVDALLGAYGGRAIVHGHSTLTGHFGVARGQVTGPVTYAAGRVTAVDGGAYDGGRLLVVPLPVAGAAVPRQRDSVLHRLWTRRPRPERQRT